MSSPHQAPSETTVLLVDSRLGPAGQSGGSITRKRFRNLPETLLIPVAFLTTIAAGIPSTTIIELLRKAVCRLWNVFHGDPATLRPDGPNPAELCDAPEVARYFATILAILGATESIISITVFGMFSHISSRYGRKPAFLIVLVAEVMSSCMIAGSQYTSDYLAGWVLLAGMLFRVFSGPLGYLMNMYVVDGCAPEERTAALSRIAGWIRLGTCISFALGGFITTKTGNPSIVLYTAATINVNVFIYVALVLPESFPEDKRSALSRMHSEPSADGLPATTRFVSLHIFEPLRALIPTRRLDGTRNGRLAWCAAHTFLFTVAYSYSWSAWLVLATSKYHLTPEDTGLFFTVISVSSTIFLMLIVPQLLRILRPYYPRKTVRSLQAEEDIVAGEGPESETSDHLDVHLAVASCAIAAISILSAAASTTSQALIFPGILTGLGSMHDPTTSNLIAGSVDPLKQGEALAAIEMVSNAGRFLSPIIFGSILTVTIEATPLLLFYVSMVTVLISSSLLFLVRDADRYQKPHEE